MSRSGYSEDLDNWALIRWRGAVNSAIRGGRGQAFFTALLDALDAMSDQRLIAGELEVAGEFCALGVLGRARGLDMSAIDPYDPRQVAGQFNIAEALAQEVVFHNDEGSFYREIPEQRWQRMRNWVTKQID